MNHKDIIRQSAGCNQLVFGLKKELHTHAPVRGDCSLNADVGCIQDWGCTMLYT